MFNRLEAFFSGEVMVDQDSWHYATYNWWRKHSRGNRPGYRENFCHYVRVILIWAPLLWLFKVPLFKRVRPWMIFTPGFIAGITVHGAMVNPKTTWNIWQVVLALLLVVALIFAAAGVIVYILYLLKISKKFRTIVTWILCPLWIPFYAVAWILVSLTERYAPIKVFGTFAATLITLCYVAIGVTRGWQAALHALLFTVVATLEIIAALAAIVFVALLVVLSVRGIYKSLTAPRRSLPKKQGGSTLKLIGQYIVARKRKICPLMIVPE